MKRKLIPFVLSAALAVSASGGLPVNAAEADVTTGNVVSFGANGSDTKDDTDAIQKALDTAKNTSGTVRVVVPAGNYYIGTPEGKTNRSLRIYSNTTLELNDKAVLIREKASPEVYIMETDEQKNITITGGTFNGNVSDTTQARGLMSLRTVSTVNISDTTFKNYCGTHAVLIDGGQGLNIRNCTFTDFKAFTGDLASYKSQTSSNSYWSAEALHIDFIEPTASSTGRNIKNVTVADCTFKGVPSGVGTHHVYDTLTADNIKIYNNFFDNCYYDCCNTSNFKNFEFYKNRAVNTPTLVHCENTTGKVYKNTLDNSQYQPDQALISSIYQFGTSRLELETLSGMELSNAKAGSEIDTTNSTNLEVYENYIKVAPYLSTTAGKICGIHTYNLAAVNAHNNVITGAPYRGIYSDTGLAVLSDNVISGCYDSVYVSNSTGSYVKGNIILSTVNRGITVFTAKDVTVSDNYVNTTSSGRGITFESCTGANLARGNVIKGAAGFGIYVISSQMDGIKANTVYSCTSDAITLNTSSEVTDITENTFFINQGNDLYMTGNSKAENFSGNTSDVGSVKVNQGCTLTDREQSALHRHDLQVTSSRTPYCLEAGYDLYSCAECQLKIKDNFTLPLGHSYKATVVEPTEEAKGYTRHVCTLCSDSYNDTYTPMLITAVKGDINSDGKVDSKDALKSVAFAKKTAFPNTDKEFLAADVNDDGKLDSKDAMKVIGAAKKIIKL